VNRDQVVDLNICVSSLPEARQAIIGSAANAGIEGEDLWAIVSAVFEACVNAVTHGTKDEATPARLMVWVDTDKYKAVVQDHGKGCPLNTNIPMPSPASNRGRGIPLMNLLMDEVRFDNNNGCRVTLTKYLNSKDKQT